jgi:hypothetical protein
MKTFLMSIIIFFSTTQSNPFIEAVVPRKDAMICFQLKTLNFEGKVVVEGRDLIRFFSEKMNLSENEYDSIMITKLQSGLIELKDSVDLKKYHFNIVKELEQVKENAFKGKEEFLKIYFNDYAFKSDSINVFNYSYPDYDKVKDEQIAVIYQLFQWKVAFIRDDETGFWFKLEDSYLYGTHDD